MMTRILAAIAAALVAAFFMSAARAEAPVKQIEEMLYPTVMVDLGRSGMGSGTIIWSGRRQHESWADEGVWSLVLTNHHVVAGAVQIKKEFDPKVGKETQKETQGAPTRPRMVQLHENTSIYNTFRRSHPPPKIPEAPQRPRDY